MGTSFSCGLLWRSRRGVARRSNRRLHPTRIGTRTATTHKGPGDGWEWLPTGPMLIGAHDPGHSRRLAHPTKGCPVWGGSGVGQTPRSRPGDAGWAGEVVSVAGNCHSSFEWPAWPCTLLGPVARPRARFPSPVLPRRWVVIHAITSSFSFQGSSVLCILMQGKDRRPIRSTGCPRSNR